MSSSSILGELVFVQETHLLLRLETLVSPSISEVNRGRLDKIVSLDESLGK